MPGGVRDREELARDMISTCLRIDAIEDLTRNAPDTGANVFNANQNIQFFLNGRINLSVR